MRRYFLTFFEAQCTPSLGRYLAYANTALDQFAVHGLSTEMIPVVNEAGTHVRPPLTSVMLLPAVERACEIVAALMQRFVRGEGFPKAFLGAKVCVGQLQLDAFEAAQRGRARAACREASRRVRHDL